MDKANDRIGNFLIMLGITPNLNGFQYILQAVEIVKETPNIKAMDMYKTIADKHNTTPSRIERCIRNAFSKISSVSKEKHFGNYKYSNMGYISVIAWKSKKGEI